MAIRVLLVDDQVLTRQGVKVVLQPEQDIEIVGEAENGREALEKAVALLPDLVLMDIMMPGGDGVTATRAIRQRCPNTRVLMLTVYADQALFRKAAEAGAGGYVLKNISPTDLADAIRSVHHGGTTLSPVIARQMMNHFFDTRLESGVPTVKRIHGLTQRESEVLVGVAHGLSDKEIAAKLFLSESTVKTHLRMIYHRLKLRNRAQAAAFAVEKGLLRTP